MQRRSALYLVLALALLLAPMAAYAAPTPAGFDAAGSNVGTLQPTGPAKETKSQEAACALLDNVKVRGLMSGMFETQLLIACGRQNELGQVKSQDTFGGEAIKGLAPLLGTDVLVNNPAGDAGGSSHTQSETSIVRNETTGTLCSAYNDSYHGVVQGAGFSGFSRSTDGGATWVDKGAFPSGAGSVNSGDPSMTWRKSDGNFYYAALHANGLGLWKSTDDCNTFTWVGKIHTGTQDDKELMAIDNTPASPYYGRMVVGWTDFTTGRIYSTYSTDAGVTWSAPVAISGSGISVQGAWPTVAPSGDIYMAWVYWQSYPAGPIDIQVVRSTNGGMSYTAVTNPLTGGTNPRAATPTGSCGRPALNGNIRYLPSPQITVTPNGNLHVVYSRDPDGYNTGDVINVYYRRSTDNGATWGAEVLLNDDATTRDQFFPTISAGPTGRVVSTWYDRRLDANNLLFDYYMRVSHDGGTTWQPSQRVSDVSSPVYIDPSLAACYHGDYDQQIQDAGFSYIQWSDDRNIQSGHQDPDVWFDKEAFAPDYTLDVTPASQSICTPANAVYTVNMGSILGYTDPVTLGVSGNPAGTTTNFSVNPVTPAGSSTLTIGNTVAAAAGSSTLTVSATSTSGPKTANVTLNLYTAIPAAPALTAPADASTGVTVLPTFTWGAVAQAVSYDIQVASDPAFTTIVASASGLTSTSYTPGAPLTPSTAYYWRVRANNICGGSSYSALAALMTANVATASFCRTPNVAIPDNNTTGVTDSQVVATAATLIDVNVSVRSTHTWVGDLIFTVTNVGTATSVTVIDRPGYTGSGFGCGNNHINATLDDGAGNPVETQCATSTATTPPPYAIDGTFTPNNPLTAFNGQALNATWQLNASDQAATDTGTLNDWCLIATYGSPFSADLSDLASGYGAAWHTGSGALRLGPGWTADTGFAAGADDATDDGVAFITPLDPGQPATVRVNVQGTPANGRWLRLWLDWDGNGVFDTTEKAYDGAAVNGNNDLTVAVPSGQTSAAKYRARLYDSASAPAAAEAIDTGSYGGATGGEVEDGTSPAPLGVTLASFTAESQAGQVLVAWETLSEVDTAGFNLYRSLSEGGERTLLAAVPAQGPGSPAGASYSYPDTNVSSSQAYWYWLEHVSLGGATTPAGSVSVIYQAPTAVTLSGIDASPAAPMALPGALPVALAGLAALAGAAGLRRRR